MGQETCGFVESRSDFDVLAESLLRKSLFQA